MTDNELRELLEQYPQRGRRALFDEYCAYVWSIAVSRLKTCGSREDIEECVSDCFAEVFSCCDRAFPTDGGLRTLIGTIAKRTAIDFFRRLSIRSGRTVSLEDETVSAGLSSGVSVEDTAERSELRRIVLREVDKLGEPDSGIILRQYFYGQNVREIARELSMTEAAVQKRSSRARQKLRKALTAAGITGLTD